MNKENPIILIILISIFLLGFLIGFLWKGDYDYTDNKYDGYWIKNRNETETKEYLQSRDKNGDWICVNINNMTYERMIAVVQHEVGHEMFARNCEKDMGSCFEIMEKIRENRGTYEH